MPELGDSVKLYFPSLKEEQGIILILNSIRRQMKDGDETSKPEIKFFRTKFGKEIMFSKDEIVISCIDGEEYIKLNEKSGIEIHSKKDIRVTSKDNLVVNAGDNLIVDAQDEIKIACKESGLLLDRAITIKGTDIKTN